MTRSLGRIGWEMFCNRNKRWMTNHWDQGESKKKATDASRAKLTHVYSTAGFASGRSDNAVCGHPGSHNFPKKLAPEFQPFHNTPTAMATIASSGVSSPECSSHSLTRAKLVCTWDDCQPSLFSDEEQLTTHLKDHAKQALNDWKPGFQCFWRGCPSKAFFLATKTYEIHLKNIHTDPLVCSVPRCKHKKPFRNDADLRRHRISVHSVYRSYVCPFESCEEKVKAFARKDKWLQHLRETPHYGDAICPRLHCTEPGHPESKVIFTTLEEIVQHFDTKHAVFEFPVYSCALGSCARTCSSERWTNKRYVAGHLKDHHGVSGEESRFIALELSDCPSPEKVLTESYLSFKLLRWNTKWHDCVVCGKYQ